ncbi:MAG: transaldolase [Actinomycetota bacterium]|nr:transaldolase [Actinomycetota bacterium]
MTRLHDLHSVAGQSPWIDNIRRDYLSGGKLAALVDEGVRGVTSNPTIFAKAIESDNAYDDQLGDLRRDHSIEECYWNLVSDDIRGALKILRSVYDASDRTDGFVSIEVSPTLAYDTAATIESARELHASINEPNLLVKIPATLQGVDAVRQMISEGKSINVTLIFSLDRYSQVLDAYMAGLETLLASGQDDLSGVASVASFFVSRVDTEVDARINAIARRGHDSSAPLRTTPLVRQEDLAALLGTAALAQAKLAYRLFVESLTTDRWQLLASHGARPQRPLWASTSTKNPAYSDLMYVENLIAPDTVNTMPDATLEAFLEHGVIKRTADLEVDAAQEAIDALGNVGIDLEDVSAVLESEGVEAFRKSFDEVLACLDAKASSLATG